ncbi:hypothetical protein GE061_017616 [Apolygus lucorum]|uniref:Uncharacterized protein n=1 Tax=Apolygus lucorum TaxID=248454 RepID=A0A6A4JG27_APOLU|nr:hypothetical protein GE061_017616 [Apolygus lucorum]
MPQGSQKNKKAKLPGGVAKKDKPKTIQKKNRPIAPKKAKHEEIAKLKKMISKNVNRKLEEEIRGAATDGQKVKLSKKKNQNPSVDPNKMPPKST